MLSQIVQKQIDFQMFLGVQIPNSNRDIFCKENINSLTFQILALFDEVSEALHCLPWKPWKKMQDFNLEHFRTELIDVLHFLINCCILSGMSAEMIFNKFIDKNLINIKRQKDGY